MPQQSSSIQKLLAQEEAPQQQFSKVAASEAEFRELIGQDSDGSLARFVDNKLNVLFWCRAPCDSRLIFGAQIALPRLVDGLRTLVDQVEPALRDEICVALLDDTAKPQALSHPNFRATWKRPFVATEIGEILPHWEVAVYLLDPAKLTRSAHTLKLTLGLLIVLLLLAIGVGSWLIVSDLNRHLTLARQKTDFVSNVSHELKTPLTSIRMFSELLAEGRVSDAAKQRSYLGIITAETARLTRLINNVLDFARIERGEKKYHFQTCDLVELVRGAAETFRPHLEANGFSFECELPEASLMIEGDRDALAQVVVNLLSNAEKYSNSSREISLRVERQSAPLPHAEVKVLDRGLGVPEGCGEKIFEQFYRAHDSLSSGIQGSGLGLTLARQIARAHGGDVVYEPREGGGSCFALRLPLKPGQTQTTEGADVKTR
jgi:signal transduction histidine kinase